MMEEAENPYAHFKIERLDLLPEVVGHSRRENRDRQTKRERNEALRGPAAGAVEEVEPGKGVEM
jgi:hypothetical protein